MPFPFTHQLDAMDCGPACLKMITDHHGRVVSLQKLREKCHISREGVSLAGISTSMRSMIYCCGSTSSVSQTHHLTDAADSTDF
ncbi:MAG: hypothetical protein IPO37_01000 [Saprospiraceae bacterium]|nr:hypothetical protein [Saprospiraceae bacterium]